MVDGHLANGQMARMFDRPTFPSSKFSQYFYSSFFIVEIFDLSTTFGSVFFSNPYIVFIFIRQFKLVIPHGFITNTRRNAPSDRRIPDDTTGRRNSSDRWVHLHGKGQRAEAIPLPDQNVPGVCHDSCRRKRAILHRRSCA